MNQRNTSMRRGWHKSLWQPKKPLNVDLDRTERAYHVILDPNRVIKVLPYVGFWARTWESLKNLVRREL